MREFDGVPRDPAGHFKLWFYAAVLRVIGGAIQRFPDWDTLFDRFPFLAHYNNELARAGFAGRDPLEAADAWAGAVAAWEDTIDGHLPLRALRQAASLDPEAMALFCALGLIEEDPRFGTIFDLLQGAAGHKRPSLGLLATWWNGGDDSAVRAHARRLQELGLALPIATEGPRSEWMFTVPPAMWDAARGEQHRELAPGVTFTPGTVLPDLPSLIGSPGFEHTLASVPGLMAGGQCGAVILRGPRHNGRGTAAGAIARAMGRGLLEVDLSATGLPDRWRSAGPLATLLHAVPFVRVEVPPGESVQLERLRGCDTGLIVAAGRHGGIGGGAVERAITVAIERPDPAARARHWTAALAGHAAEEIDTIVDRFRLTSGHITRASQLARARATAAGRPAIGPDDVREAARTLSRETLEALATWLPPTVDWRHVSVAPHVKRDLEDLERRCRRREQLRHVVGPALASQLTCKTVAMISGPSGVGKSLAARALAASLQMDLYRVEVSAILDKYVGEAEKRLHQLFTRAQELDVVLLLDEGDSLMARRTAVSSATDKYSNAETSVLLQILDDASFDGILLISTNAADRVDQAFLRRMDTVIEFTLPEAVERFAIWQMHLPAAHAVDERVLAAIASSCALTGGQIRNAVLHACALALDAGRPVAPPHVRAAVEREYRKAGGVCPLPKFEGVLAHAG